MENILNNIERNYDVSAIKANGLQIWPWLRLEFMYISLKQYKSKVINRKLNNKSILDIFLGYTKWFRTYDYLIFSSSNQRVQIQDKMYDKSVDYIIDTLGPDNCLTVEIPFPSHFQNKKYYTKNIVSFRVIDILRLFLTLFSRRKIHISNAEIINKILQEYNLSLRSDLNKLINRFNIDIAVYKILLRIYKPKAVFINNAYGKMALVYSANMLGVKTIEVQHGVIGYQHPAYNSEIGLDSIFYPCSILLYGNNDKLALEKSRIYSKTKLFVVGNYYIDEKLSCFKRKPFIFNRLKPYIKRIGVTLQLDFELELIEFIKKVAIKTPNNVFILIPRGAYKNDISKLNLPNNIITDIHESFYDIIQYCDIHTTIYSTCALEAPSFNIPNILYNYNGLSKLYFDNVLDFDIHQVANNVEEYINAINRLRITSNILLDNSSNYKPGYKQNIKEVISQEYK